MELAFRLNVSQRHVSYVERGRAGASRSLIRQWARETRCHAWILNSALLQAGYAPDADQASDTADALSELSHILDRHGPFPAHIFDAAWRIATLNEPAAWLCHLLMPDLMRRCTSAIGLDMIAACADRGGLLSHMVNRDEFAANQLCQLRAEATVRRGLARRVAELEDQLRQWLGPIGQPSRDAGSTMMNMHFITDYGDLRFSTAQGSFGLIGGGLCGSFRVELWFPSDDFTRDVMVRRSSG